MDDMLIPVEKAMSYLPKITIPYNMAVALCQGVRQTDLSNCTFENCDENYEDAIQVRSDNDVFIGVAHIHKGVLISDRVMSDPLQTQKFLNEYFSYNMKHFRLFILIAFSFIISIFVCGCSDRSSA